MIIIDEAQPGKRVGYDCPRQQQWRGPQTCFLLVGRRFEEAAAAASGIN